MSTLRSGLTTGTCAAAAAKAAATVLSDGAEPSEVDIALPDGTRLHVPLVFVRRIEGGAEAAVRKDAGDDPDITNGATVVAGVSWCAGDAVAFKAGEGVGTVTRVRT